MRGAASRALRQLSKPAAGTLLVSNNSAREEPAMEIIFSAPCCKKGRGAEIDHDERHINHVVPVAPMMMVGMPNDVTVALRAKRAANRDC